MNRHQRRAGAKDKAPGAASLPPMVESNIGGATDSVLRASAAKPGFFIRAIAAILLSDWVLKRIHQRQTLALLEEVAIQAGRPDAIYKLRYKAAHL